MSPEQIKALPTPELVALYNKTTGKSIKRFASRADGERLVLKALAVARPAPAAPPATVRTVNGKASGRNGRPKSKYIVQLTEEKAKSKPHKSSDRWSLIEWLRSSVLMHNGAQLLSAATIDSIEAHFNRRMRGVVQKLVEKAWMKRIEFA